MRVLIVAGYYWPAIEWGGPARSIPLLARAVRNAGAQVEVITTTTRGSAAEPTISPGKRDIYGVPTTYCDAHGPRRFYFAPSLARKVIQGLGRADIVYLHGLWTFPPLWTAMACQTRKTPYILSPRGSLERWSLSHKSRKKALWLQLIGHRILSGAALLHLTAEAERVAMPESMQSYPMEVVPNPVDIAPLLDVPDTPPVHNGFRLMTLGRVHKVKGFDLLLPAIAQLVARGVDVNLRVVGPDEGGYAAEVERMAEDLGIRNRINLLGAMRRPGVIVELTNTDALVMSSYQENFGMAAAEAMAAARPVVVTDQVSIASDIHRGGAGYVTRLDSSELADALVQLASSQQARRAMGAKGRELVKTQYSEDAVGARMVQVLEDVIASRGTRL